MRRCDAEKDNKSNLEILVLPLQIVRELFNVDGGMRNGADFVDYLISADIFEIIKCKKQDCKENASLRVLQK